MDVLALLYAWAQILSEFAEPNLPLPQHGSFVYLPHRFATRNQE